MVAVSTRARSPCYDKPRKFDLIQGDGSEVGVDHTAAKDD